MAKRQTANAPESLVPANNGGSGQVYDQLELLSAMGQEFASSLDIEASLKRAIEHITGYVNAEGGALFMLEDEGKTLRCHACVGPTEITGLDKATQSMDALVLDIKAMVKDVQTEMLGENGDIQKTMGETRYIVESVSRHIDSINQNMDGAARNMYEFSRQIRQNPGLLLGGQAPEDQSKNQ